MHCFLQTNFPFCHPDFSILSSRAPQATVTPTRFRPLHQTTKPTTKQQLVAMQKRFSRTTRSKFPFQEDKWHSRPLQSCQNDVFVTIRHYYIMCSNAQNCPLWSFSEKKSAQNPWLCEKALTLGKQTEIQTKMKRIKSSLMLCLAIFTPVRDKK